MKLFGRYIWLERPAGSGWAAVALGIGGVITSAQLAWAQMVPATPPETLFSHLLPSIIGGAAAALLSWGAMRIRVSEVERRITKVEEDKTSKDVYAAEIASLRREMHNVNTTLNDVIRDLVARLDARARQE